MNVVRAAILVYEPDSKYRVNDRVWAGRDSQRFPISLVGEDNNTLPLMGRCVLESDAILIPNTIQSVSTSLSHELYGSIGYRYAEVSELREFYVQECESLVTRQQQSLSVPLVNTEDHPLVIPKGTFLGYVHAVDVVVVATGSV